MESLTGHDAVEAEGKIESKTSKAPDRVTLGKLEGDKVERWLSQINMSSKGFLALTKTDVVNFLIRQHKEEFLPKELLQIRADHYDPIRHITWITPQIKAALASGDIARVADLQAELRGVELSVIKDATARLKDKDSIAGATPPAKRKKPRAASKLGSELKSNSMPEVKDDEVKIDASTRENSPSSHDM